MATRPCSSKIRQPKFTELNNLSSAENGAVVLFSTDDWFAAAENLLQDSDPVWKEGVFDAQGKWMDGWETRRKRIPGHDWAIIQLAYPGIIHGIVVNTSYFTGNYTPRVSIQAANLKSLPEGFQLLRQPGNGKAATSEEFESVALLKSEDWTTLVPMTPLGPGYIDTCRNYFEIPSREKWTHLRLNMFPDGGIARLRVYGQVRRTLHDIVDSARRLSEDLDLIDLVAMENGGMCLGYSDAHYGHPRNMIMPTEPENMGQGWETARRLDRPEILTADENGILQVPGNEWSIFRLGVIGHIIRVQVDTTHFKGNFPDSFTLEAGLFYACDKELENSSLKWTILLPRTKLGPNQKHFFDVPNTASTFTHVRITMAPDGGIARMRLWGRPAQE